MLSVIVNKVGGPEVLEVREVPLPEAGPGEVRILVKAAGINYADIMQREGLYPGGPTPPFGAGFEVAGIIDAVGPGVTQWRVGDEVMSFCSAGYSEFVTAKTWQVMPKPAGLSFAQAAAVPCQFFTAHHALVTLGRLSSGQTVLIQAAAGGLGMQLVQIARNLRADIIGTASTAEKCARIEALGCRHPVLYTEQDVHAAVMAITENRGCDLVIESVGGEVFNQSLKCLKPRGMLVTLGVASKHPPTVSAVQLLANNWIVAGFHLMAYMADADAMARAMADLNTWLAEDKLQLIIGSEFPLAEAAAAQQFISDRKSFGKVVLVP